MPPIDKVERRSVTLRTARLDLREFHRREGEVLLHGDILDHQLVDTDEVQVIRAAGCCPFRSLPLLPAAPG